ncbi:hypothetical protein [Streptomyces flavofungini]|uniref:Uncharacterized protein n=1 Tax=Streptomyces flavofungini TaxID=68200 RepID=A0ABS0X1I8_9ACTN|nr:hypothetical protein [Streptomyces flavofungini]MBJ3807043.1 hypothetical protein [Streptomyces flavofungini]GHC75311.1 hypothetical protein GCM10010349_54490 [Streptomyces flavofungini]
MSGSTSVLRPFVLRRLVPRLALGVVRRLVPRSASRAAPRHVPRLVLLRLVLLRLVLGQESLLSKAS